jgi:carbamoyltransferase
MKLLGLWSGHDASFCVLNNGLVEMHTELERHLRVKEPPGDSIDLFYKHYGDTQGLVGIATCHLAKGIKAHAESWKRLEALGVPLYVVGHHQAHAANAFYSSNFDEAVIITIDGGGIEDKSGFCVGASVWVGKGTKIEVAKHFPLEHVNIGGVWSRVTRHVFKYESGWPFGNQAGTTMALAALAKDAAKFVPRFRDMFDKDLQKATARAPGHVAGMSAKDPQNPEHPYLKDLADLAAKDEQAKYDMAGAMQKVTEEQLFHLVTYALLQGRNEIKNVCFSGGVALNSVAMGKLVAAFPDVKFYIPPVPYDAGLTIGAAQYAWHHILDNPRVAWDDNATPYLGPTYSREQVWEALDVERAKKKINVEHANDDSVTDLLIQGKIVAVFHGRAESGRRALGNRSILADPRSPEMKDRVNEKVKHRQWFRPFAPSVLREYIGEWFENDHESPFMGFVLRFKSDKTALVPAVVHFDGTARLQTVTAKSNPWYHGFITRFYDKTGVPLLLNTSFNDREPICETPAHALNCFLGTDIDYLYYADFNLLINKTP